jgi:hypothetical protein
MIVVNKDGFIDWAWGSKRLFKSGIYYRASSGKSRLPASLTIPIAAANTPLPVTARFTMQRFNKRAAA